MAGKLKKGVSCPDLWLDKHDMMLFEPEKAEATYQKIDHDEIMEKMSDRVSEGP